MRHILLIFTIIFLSLTTFARGVDHATAERVATAFWRMNAPQHLKELPLQQIASTRYGDNLYLWTSDSGFVIVAGSYSVRPVLAYGFGCDAQSDNMPPQMVEWIDDYASVIGQIERDGIAQEDGVAAEWHRLLTAGEGKTTKGGVPALITTKWNQGAPYNLMCPIDTVRQRRCVAGCVAIAMAQIMKYWNYPLHGKGTHRYSAPNFGLQSADFENTYYDWANMPDAHFETAEQQHAVAELVYHCGVAVNMGYGVGESGAYTCLAPDGVPKAQTSLATFFDYQPTLSCLHRDNYDDNTWIAMLASEIESARPILMTGSDPSAGHAFILDGTDDESRFHINWGWGGGWDGHYAVGAFSPGAGGAGGNATYTFNLNNAAIMGIIPNGVLKCTPERATIGQRGGVATTFVSSNVLKDSPWSVSSDADWVSFDPTSGNGMGDTTIVTINIAPNTSNERRSATITFAQDGDIAVMTLCQTECSIIDSFPYFESFEDSIVCWNSIALDKLNSGDNRVVSVGNDANSGSNVFRFSSVNTAPNYDQYLISPYMELPSEATMSLYYKRDYSYDETFEVLASTDSVAHFDSFTNRVRRITVNKTGWKQTSFKLPKETHFVALHYTSQHQRTLSIDDIKIDAVMPKPEGISDIEAAQYSIVTSGNQIVVGGCRGEAIALYDIMGRRIAHTAAATDDNQLFAVPSQGIYILRIGSSASRKIVVMAK
ncbi:MAG: C10 family peptidase [Bacteroidales bacterium]|nr:C10 family peptidase [Bacteroidales bacterium]